MRVVLATCLAYAASALAYTVLVPNQSEGWTDHGPQPFVWHRDHTDRANFTVVLTNPNRDLMPFDQVLAALVDGNLGNTTLNPPSAGWPAPGPNYRLNIIDSTTNETVLASSPAFDIEHTTVSRSSTITYPTTVIRYTQTEHPNAIPTDDTLGGDDNGSATSYNVPVALAAFAAAVPALFL